MVAALDSGDCITSELSDRIIVLDPGHGGEDPGSIGITDGSGIHFKVKNYGDLKKKYQNGTLVKEKDITWEICELLESKLTGAEADVFMTREENENPRDSERVSEARSHLPEEEYNKKDLIFVSIHCNALGWNKKNKKYLEQKGVYVYVEEKKEDLYFAYTHAKKNTWVPIPKTEKWGKLILYGPHKFSKKLVTTVSESFGGTSNSSSKVVLSFNDISAILIETGYITNPQDVESLVNNKGGIANSIFEGICNYFKYDMGINITVPDPSGWDREEIKSGPHKGKHWGPFIQEEKEYVTIKNNRQYKEDIGCWTVADAAGHKYKFPARFILERRGSVKVRTGEGTNSKTDRYIGYKTHIWNNEGDTAYLRDHHKKLVTTSRR